MPTANPILEPVADTSDLRKMFGIFCVYIFECRDNVLENDSGKIADSVIQAINADSAENISESANEKSAEQTPAIAISSSPIKDIDRDHAYDFRIIHKNIRAYLKSAIDSEKISAFHKNTRKIIYAMAAIADEIFLNMEWSGKQFWELNMLESKFFGTQIAGEEIYTQINKLLSENDPLCIEIAEIYIKMLSLGFKGKFRGTDDEETIINTYRNKIFDFILQHDKNLIDATEYRIFQKEYTYTMPTIYRKLLPDGSIVTYISLFFVFMFLVVSTLVWFFETKDLNRLLLEISSIALRE